MKPIFLTSAAAALLSVLAGAPAIAADYSQLIRSAGLTPAEASGMTIDEIAAHKFSRESNDSQQIVVRRAPLQGSAPARSFVEPRESARSLDAAYVEMINRSAGNDERQTLPPRQ